MKTLKTKSFDLSQRERPHEQSSDSTRVLVNRSAESSRTPEEKQIQLAQLETLAEMPDDEIDFSDIPEWTEEDFRRAVQGAHAPKSAHPVTLYLDDATASWLRSHAKSQSILINFALKQAVQHGRRALRERKEGTNRPIYDTTSEVFRQGLEFLSGKRAAEQKYVELPEYSDAELKAFGQENWPELKPVEVILLVDNEVFAWLQKSASSYALRTNYAIRHVANRSKQPSSDSSLSKAS